MTQNAPVKQGEPVKAEPVKPKSDIEKLICSKQWNCERAIKIAKCESTLNPSAVNNNPKTKDYSVGLFQINLHGKLKTTRPSESWLKVAQNNIDYAHKMYQASGWHPWSCNRKV